jgi:hypothetical protein
MIENEYIKKDEFLLTECDEIITKASILKNLFIKKTIKKTETVLEEIDDAINWLYNHEKRFYAKLIDTLENKDAACKEYLFSKTGDWNDIKYNLLHYADIKESILLGFDLIMLNDRTIGYIGIGSRENLKNYILPLSFNINSCSNTIISNKINSPREIQLSLAAGKVISFYITLHFAEQVYDLKVIAGNEYNISNISFVTKFEPDGEISIVLVHENSYRFKISPHHL